MGSAPAYGVQGSGSGSAPAYGGVQGSGSAPAYGGTPGTGSAPVYGGAPGYGPPRGYPPGGPAPAAGVRGSGPQRTQTLGSPPGAAPTTGAAAIVTAAPGKKDLTMPKVMAGAGAAATSAILGSFFGAMGTVTGAALGSVFSAIVTTGLEKSLEKTRDTVKARVKLPGGRTVDVTGKTDVPAPEVAPGGEVGTARVYVTPGDRPTEVLPVVSGTGPTAKIPADGSAATAGGPRWSRKKLLVMTGFTVVVFALAMLAVTGIELVKGSPLNTGTSTAQRPGGTSLGSVLGGDSKASTETSAPEATESATEDDPSAEATAGESPDEEEAPAPTAGRGSPGAEDEETPAPSRSPRITPTPTPDADSGDAGGGAGGLPPNARSGGGADTPDQQ